MKLTDREIVTKVLESCGWKLHYGAYDYEQEDTAPSYWVNQFGISRNHPALLTSRDACFAVFANDAPHEFWRMLAEDLVKIPGPIPYKATARQLCLAWLRYKGIDIGETV